MEQYYHIYCENCKYLFWIDDPFPTYCPNCGIKLLIREKYNKELAKRKKKALKRNKYQYMIFY